MDDTSSAKTLGRYQIIREIARSNDIVYEALDPTINRRIALKELLIPPNLQGSQRRERIDRFWREGKAAGRLSHPNIVTVFEVGRDGERYFIAMEFLEGQTLRDVLQSGGPLPIQTVIDYGIQLCSALAYAHRNGVIHRDVKPENVQILPGGHLKLTDFGIARIIGEPGITQDGQVFGTPSYMSPEQVAGKPLDARSDLFSLGVLLYEMTAGKKPFAGDSVVTITYNIVNMDPEPPPGAPPFLVGIIRKAMCKDPDGRYQSAEDMLNDLKEQKCDPLFARDIAVQPDIPPPFGPAGAQTQQQSVPITPYGTPVPSPTAGSGYAPDPFAQPVPLSTAPPVPPRPLMSAETRNFLGILFLVVAVAGLAIFAVWAISLAYQSYVTAQTSEAAARYYEQGRRLHSAGRLDVAAEQYLNAIRISPRSPAAGEARKGLYAVWTVWADRYRALADSKGLMEIGGRMVELDPKGPEGHFFLGFGHELVRDFDKAEDEYRQASLLAGNDEAGYGRAARERLEIVLRARQQEPAPSPSGTGGASEHRAPESDIPFQPAGRQ